MSDSKSKPSDEFIDLEIKLGFLERTIDDLNDVILDQNQNIERLVLRITKLEQRIANPGNQDEEQRNLEDDRPPHY